MTHNINWNIDVAKVLAIILIFLLLLFGYKQINIEKKINKLENDMSIIDEKIESYNINCMNNQLEERIKNG